MQENTFQTWKLAIMSQGPKCLQLCLQFLLAFANLTSGDGLQIKETVALAIQERQDLHNSTPPWKLLIFFSPKQTINITFPQTKSPPKTPNSLSEHFRDLDTCHETILLISCLVFSIHKNFQPHLVLVLFTYPSEFQSGLQRQKENTISKTCKANEVSWNH